MLEVAEGKIRFPSQRFKCFCIELILRNPDEVCSALASASDYRRALEELLSDAIKINGANFRTVATYDDEVLVPQLKRILSCVGDTLTERISFLVVLIEDKHIET